MVGPWIGAKLATTRSGGIGGGALIAQYTFATPAADANGYVSETGAKALSVWAGAANVAAGTLQSNTTALMRARFNAGAQPGYWKAAYTTPSNVVACEFYLDIRDNATNRISCAFDTTHSYIFNGYTATELVSAAAIVAINTTYTVEVTDSGGLITVYVNGSPLLAASTASGAGATTGGVTTTGQVVAIDNLEARA